MASSKTHSLGSSSEALPISDIDSDMSADEGNSSSTSTSATASAASSNQQQQENRILSLQQANRVVKVELEMYKLRCKQMQEENKQLRKTSVSIQAKAEQQEEFMSNTLMKKINTLKNEKEVLAMNYEKEEEFLTNDLSKKLLQLKQEKITLEQTLEQEQEFQVNKLIRRIERLEAETVSKQQVLEQLRKEKIDLENTLEQEQEALVNRLWVRMEKLEAEKRLLQAKLDQPVSEPASPQRKGPDDDVNVENLSLNVNVLRQEVITLRNQLAAAQAEHNRSMSKYESEESMLREENVRLQRKLLLEMERREQLSRQLSESESSLEMDDERHFNEATHGGTSGFRDGAISSPIPDPTQHTPVLGIHTNTNSYPAFTPPSPLGASRISSAASSTSIISSSPPYAAAKGRGVIQSPKLPRKVHIVKSDSRSSSLVEASKSPFSKSASEKPDKQPEKDEKDEKPSTGT